MIRVVRLAYDEEGRDVMATFPWPDNEEWPPSRASARRCSRRLRRGWVKAANSSTADVLVSILKRSRLVRSIDTFQYDTTKVGGVGAKLEHLNYTALKAFRKAGSE